jgi:DNA-binding phage protein
VDSVSDVNIDVRLVDDLLVDELLNDVLERDDAQYIARLRVPDDRQVA